MMPWPRVLACAAVDLLQVAICGIWGKSLDVFALGTIPASGRNSHLEFGPFGGNLGEWLGTDPREALVALASTVLVGRVISV